MRDIKKKVIGMYLLGAGCLLVMTIVFFSTLEIVKVNGQSMEPNLNQGDYKIAQKDHYTIERGDIVVYENEKDKIKAIKRVVGMPNDTITIENCHIFINGTLLNEEYLDGNICTLPGDLARGELYTVPKEQYFLLGDNRIVSKDSRFTDIGFVRKENIHSKVVGNN